MKPRTCAGYTLVELILVLAILAIAAAVAIPSAEPVAEFQADAAAGEITLALRFARDDARRSGQGRVFACNVEGDTVTVGAIDTDKDKSILSSTPVFKPASRDPYAVAFANSPATNQMAIVSCTFTFADNPTAATLAFDASGNPVRGIGTGPARTKPLRSGVIVIGAGPTRRTIALDVTGRITLS